MIDYDPSIGGIDDIAAQHGDTFERQLESLINCYSQENASNTPDFILAQFLLGCLATWNTAVQQRETWYGRDARPTASVPKEPGVVGLDDPSVPESLVPIPALPSDTETPR